MFISTIEYADDCCMISQSIEDQQKQLDILNEICLATGLTISQENTKVMSVRRTKDTEPALSREERSANRGSEARVNPRNIQLQGKDLERVDTFVYLGRLLACDGSLGGEITRRLARMRASYFKMNKEIYEDTFVDLKVRLSIFNAVVVANALYGCEIWNTTAQQIQRVETQQLKLLRRLFNVRNSAWGLITPVL